MYVHLYNYVFLIWLYNVYTFPEPKSTEVIEFAASTAASSSSFLILFLICVHKFGPPHSIRRIMHLKLWQHAIRRACITSVVYRIISYQTKWHCPIPIVNRYNIRHDPRPARITFEVICLLDRKDISNDVHCLNPIVPSNDYIKLMSHVTHIYLHTPISVCLLYTSRCV